MELSRTLDRLAQGQKLSREESMLTMNVIMTGGATPAQIGAFLMALRVRGETSEEIAGAADSMRSHAVRIHSDRKPLIDTCGTGGDGIGTFNISTASGFVVAGAGVAVAKHGNRSVSSRWPRTRFSTVWRRRPTRARSESPPTAGANRWCSKASNIRRRSWPVSLSLSRLARYASVRHTRPRISGSAGCSRIRPTPRYGSCFTPAWFRPMRARNATSRSTSGGCESRVNVG